MIGYWIKQHTIALVCAGIFSLSSFFRYIPLHECCVIWQSGIEVMIEFLHGFANIFTFLIFRQPEINNIWITFLILFIYGFILGLFLEHLLRADKWKAISLPSLLIAINFFFGCCTSTLNNPHIGKPYATCQKRISETTAIRIVVYPGGREFLPGGYFFFSASHNAGETWKQFMVIYYDEPINPLCENIHSLSSNQIWVWMGWQAAISKDSGKTWYIWTLKENWPDWKYGDYGQIEDISFKDNMNGRMKLEHILELDQTTFLITENGGITWEMENK